MAGRPALQHEAPVSATRGVPLLRFFALIARAGPPRTPVVGRHIPVVALIAGPCSRASRWAGRPSRGAEAAPGQGLAAGL